MKQNTSLGIILSDKQTQDITAIQYVLSDSLNRSVSFEKTVYYLILLHVDDTKLLPEVRNILSGTDCTGIAEQILESSVNLEDYI